MQELKHYEKQERPWGNFERFTLNESSTVKLVTVRANESISLQTHAHRDEFWRVLSGTGTIRIGENTHAARAGESYFSPRTSEHRIEAGPEGLTVLEIAFGDFSEADISRLEDKYGRA